MAESQKDYEAAEPPPSQPFNLRHLWLAKIALKQTTWIGFSLGTIFVIALATVWDIPNHPSVGPWKPNVAQIVQAANAANERIDNATADSYVADLAAVRTILSSSIKKLEDTHPDQSKALRKKLINRLFQSPEPDFATAELHLIKLNAPPEEPQTLRWMALALTGQVIQATYSNRDPGTFTRHDNYWKWLSNQKPGNVLLMALKQSPSDISLVARAVELFNGHPESFTTPGETDLHNCVTRKQIEPFVRRLTANSDSRSLLVRHAFQHPTDPKLAFEILKGGAQAAFHRIQLVANSPSQVNASTRPSYPQTPSNSLSIEQPESYWDFLLLSFVANGLKTSNPKVAADYFECLTGTPSRLIPLVKLESAFLQFGHLACQQNDPHRALAVWKRGLDQVDFSSLKLNDAIARLVSTHHRILSTDDGQETLSRYRAAIESKRLLLASSTPSEMSSVARKELGRAIRAAKWRHSVLDSKFKHRTGNSGVAIDQLGLTLAQSADVNPIEEVVACQTLARWFTDEGAYDCAATWYERAISLRPNDFQLRCNAAESWTLSGNHLRALDHWQKIRGSNSLKMQVASLEARFQASLRTSRNGESLVNLAQECDRLQQRIRNTRSQDYGEANLRILSSRVEVIAACLNPKSFARQHHLRSRDVISTIVSIGNEYPDDVKLQTFIAEFLAAAGEREQALDRVKALMTRSQIKDSESAVINARVMAATGLTINAAKFLIEHAKKNTCKERDFLLMATDWALKSNNYELAYRALKTISAELRTSRDLFTLSQLADKLHDSTMFSSPGTETSARWTRALKQREPNSCAFSVYLKAEALIDRVVAGNQSDRSNDADLSRAKKLVHELISVRPSWSHAVALAGELSCAEGHYRLAVRQMRDAIMLGDQRASTRRRVEQLETRTVSPKTRWAHLASFQTVERLPVPKYSGDSIVDKLLAAHRHLTGPSQCDKRPNDNFKVFAKSLEDFIN